MGPLAGIRVLDFTRVVAGPLATRILADQGAEVIKVEPPEGDLSRTFPPLLENEITPYFAQQNAGKLFCSFDLSHDETPQLVAELATKCDVIVENFRPGVMAKYGLDYETLSKKKSQARLLQHHGVRSDWALGKPESICTHWAFGIRAH